MKNFNNESRFKKKPSRSVNAVDSGRFGRKNSAYGSSFDKQTHKATCGRCGVSCEVPFRPTEGKPVYCNNCFKKEDNSASRKSNHFKRNDRFEPRRTNSIAKKDHAVKPDQYKKEFEQINRKLDKILEAQKGK